jgi:hypothetical protein
MNRSGEILLHPCYAHDASGLPQRGQNRASGRSVWYPHLPETLFTRVNTQTCNVISSRAILVAVRLHTGSCERSMDLNTISLVA